MLCLVDLFDLNFKKLHHRNIFRPCDAPVRTQRRGLLVPSKNLTQRQTAGDRVGIGIVLEKDQHRLRSFKMFLDVETSVMVRARRMCHRKFDSNNSGSDTKCAKDLYFFRNSLGFDVRTSVRNVSGLLPQVIEDGGKSFRIFDWARKKSRLLLSN
jgi:hypothetical protein